MRLVAVLGHAAHVVRAVSLADLYFCVPAAEEEDLLEQHAVEQHQEWLLREYAPWIDIDLTEPEPAKPDVDAGDVDAGQLALPTHAQAVGIVQHLLGAHLLREQ